MFIFSAAGPTALRDCENHPRSVAATLARELAIANINPDVVLLLISTKVLTIVIPSQFLKLQYHGKQFVFVTI